MGWLEQRLRFEAWLERVREPPGPAARFGSRRRGMTLVQTGERDPGPAHAPGETDAAGQADA